MERAAIYWFRKDLRLRDNFNLANAAINSSKLLPVFILDENYWDGNFPNGMEKMSRFRKDFLLQSLFDLKNNLRARGSDLLIIKGSPTSVLESLVNSFGSVEIFTSLEPGYDEQKQLENLRTTGLNVTAEYDNFLYNPAEIPFNLESTPEIFTKFRGKCEKYGKLVDEVNDITLPPLPNLPNELDNGFDLFKDVLAEAEKTDLRFRGGETEAWKRLNYYFYEIKGLAVYKETRNGLLGDDYSSKFSPWLAWGCISPISIYHEVKAFELAYGKSDNTYWLIFELLWRDYFRYISLKHGRSLYTSGGLKNKENTEVWPSILSDKFESWCNGKTGYPFVDANMLELKKTGYMSNRGRQNVASFLVKDLNLDWRLGAAWFEQNLLDYDCNSNYGNWLYVAGLGNDPREDRYFNVLIQAIRYDSEALYVKHYFPELKNLSPKIAHQPWLAPQVHYVKPLVRVKADL
ncbi:MAG: DASH family cryptochrome [Luteibaculaceae bacterium]